MPMQIMLVDDDVNSLTLFGLVFQRDGFAVLKARDGFGALKLLEESEPDIFLLDVMMDGMDGIELCRLLRERPESAQTPVLFFSAWPDPLTIEKCLAAGANDYLVKPVHPRDLLAKARDLLGMGEGELSRLPVPSA